MEEGFGGGGVSDFREGGGIWGDAWDIFLLGLLELGRYVLEYRNFFHGKREASMRIRCVVHKHVRC